MIDPESNRILELARSARTPSEADKAAVERKLAAALGIWAGAGTATAAAASSGQVGTGKLAAGAALKWWLSGATALIGAGAVGYVALSSPAAEPARAGQGQGRVPAARIEPAQAVAAPAVVAAAGDAAATETAVATETATATETAAAETAEVAPRTTHRERRREARGAQAGEVELLHRAQSAWRSGQARAALELLDQHRARFARSSLRSERDALRALCLCEVGRGDEAQQLARKVLARDPNTPLRAALERSCAR